MHRCASLITVALLALLAAAPTTAQDEIYKWVDEDGVVHFGERPPADGAAERVEVEPLPTIPVPAPPPGVEAPPGEDAGEGGAQAGEEELSYAEQRRRERAEARAEALHEQQVLEENCKRMRAQLAALEPHPRVIVTDPDGNPRRLTDEERLSALEEARKYVAENCEGR